VQMKRKNVLNVKMKIFFRNNNPDQFMEDVNFIGPKKSVNEAMALINKTFTELVNKGYVLKYKTEFIDY